MTESIRMPEIERAAEEDDPADEAELAAPLCVTWRIFLTDSCHPDLDLLTPADRAAITDELFAWVPDGPPRTRGQVVAGVQLFENQLPWGISVTHFVDEGVPYVSVVRVRRR